MASFSSLIDEDGSLVDLYALLDVPRDADTALLRRRIAQLYLEAQENLDHRNFRRRFYYQELFEVFLPQAHHILLDEKRRAQYNVQLVVRNRNAPAAATPQAASTRAAPAPAAAPLQPPAGETVPSKTAPLKTAPPEVASPEPTTPETVPLKVAPPETVPSAPPTEEPLSEQQLQHELQDDLIQSLAGDSEAQARAEEVIRKRPPTPEWARMDAERVAQRRDAKRRELIKQELIATGRRFGVLAGIVCAAACLLLTLIFATAFGGEEGAPLFLYLAALAVAAGAAFFGAREASRQARRRVVAQLSQMPYEDLLRRCGIG